MSDKNNHQEQEEQEEHESAIKTPRQLITVIILAFIIPIIVIILLANYANFSSKDGAGSNSFSKESIQKRIAPVAQLNYKDPNAPIVYKTGKDVYESLCISCHASGAAGAPKFGSKEDWSARLPSGLDSLTSSILNGKGAMAARAGSSPDDYSDYELIRAIVYMANSSGGNLQEPNKPQPEIKKQDAAADATVDVDANVSNPAIVADSKEVSTETKVNIGSKIYEEVCIACHGSGAGGAPKLDDKQAWSARIAAGKNTLYASAINGKNAMPAKGGSSYSDDEIKAVVDYMVSQSK